MSALMKSVKIFSRINKNPAAIYTLVRNASHWNKDFQPGPIPQTEEERRAAAKKYGLLPEEYKPYGVDQMVGDYPHLEDIPTEQKDSFYPYDFPEFRRNFNEPLHAHFDFYDETHVGTPAPLRYSYLEMLSMFLGVVIGSLLLLNFFEDKKMFRPAMPKQFPNDGKKHYTFEPAR